MSVVTARHQPNLGAIRVMLTSPSGPVGRDMYRRGHRVRSVAVRLVGVDHGTLRGTIGVQLVSRAGRPVARIGSWLDYAYVHHEGRRAIVVRRKARKGNRPGALRFKAAGRWIFRKRVGPAEGTKYLTRALPAARG